MLEEFLIEFKQLFTTLHVLSMSVGVGSATLTDVFFFRFLRNFKISKEEAKLMNVLSAVIWTALIAAILTGAALYLSNPAGYNATPKFLAKMIIVGVILLNGLLLNFYISPRLTHISFMHHPTYQIDYFRHFRRLAFASGAISLTSWYAALTLGSLRKLPLEFNFILALYAAALIGAVISSQLLEHRYVKRARARQK